MVAKMLLPHFGGTPAVWIVSLVFFQTVLLCGYAFAHFSLRLLGVRRQSLLQLGLLLVPLVMLPIAVAADAGPGENPHLGLLWALAAAAGLPFLVVTTASPVLQRWFSACGDAASRDPYFLYAAGNAGSLLGLLAYPVLIEPLLTLPEQATAVGGRLRPLRPPRGPLHPPAAHHRGGAGLGGGGPGGSCRRSDSSRPSAGSAWRLCRRP